MWTDERREQMKMSEQGDTYGISEIIFSGL